MEEERRRIVIPIGDDAKPQSASDQSFFDTQSREKAQPVVPLSGTSTMSPATPAARSGKLKVIAVFLVTAICAAIAAGVYVFVIKGRGQTEPLAAVQPVAGKTMATLPWTHTPEEPVVTEDGTTPVSENNNSSDRAKDSQARADRAASSRDQKRANKQARAKPGKRNDNRPDDPMKQTEDQLHRIRDIFEGPP